MNMPILTQFSNEKTMSTREISDLTEKRHPDVKRDCEIMFKGLHLDVSKFAHIYFDSMNRQQTEYLLDEELTMTLVTGYNIVLRNKVIKRWKELETQQKPTELSRMDLIQLALQAEQENQALRGQVAILEPKAIALDTIADTSNTYTIRECVKSIGRMGEKELIKLLIDKKWCYRDANQKLQPSAQFVKNGVFLNRTSPVITSHDGQERVFLHMRVTAFGLTRIAGMVNKAVGVVA